MSLNNKQMLPAKIRGMKQMQEVLTAEDTILSEIEQMIDEMYQRASQLHEELINEKWLKKKLTEKTGADTEVIEYAEKLLVEIVLNVSELQFIDMLNIRGFLEKWLPAHLVYRLILLLFYETCCREKYILHQIRCECNVCFWGNFLLDGTLLLNGKSELRFYCAKQECGCVFAIDSLENHGKHYLGVIFKHNFWILDGSCDLSGMKKLGAEKREEML